MVYMITLTDFFGIGGYERTPEGAWSFEHIFFTSGMILITIILGIYLGIKYKQNHEVIKKTIVIAAIVINLIEIIKIVVLCIRSGDPLSTILHTLPLFLCSIMLIALPLAAFTKGRLKEACLDFILIFGFIAGVFGTVGAAQNYNAYPVLSIDNVSSAITHCISAFASIFIGITGISELKMKNMWITFSILITVVLLAQIANIIVPYNYMFLEFHDGTPYSIFYDLVNGNLVLYKLIVVGLFVILIGIFYLIKTKVNVRHKSES